VHVISFKVVDLQQRAQHPKAVAEWEHMDVKPRMERGKFYSVFQVNFKKGEDAKLQDLVLLFRTSNACSGV
jgi:hypothetical protein